MLAPSIDVLRAGMALKLNQIKRATRSYARDRANQATGTATSYVVAAGLFAASGIFLIAALLVGLAALFRWIELTYGRFQAFGAIGGLLVLIAIICAALAANRLHRPPRHFPSLSSRLRVAIMGRAFSSEVDTGSHRENTSDQGSRAPLRSNRNGQGSRPLEQDPAEARQGTAATRFATPSTPTRPAAALQVEGQIKRQPLTDNRQVQAGLILAASLLGWVALRRKSQKRQLDF